MKSFNYSIAARLCILLFIAISAATFITSFLSFKDADEQVAELFDAEMAQLARVIQGLLSGSGEESIRYPDDILKVQDFLDKEYTEYGHAYERKLSIQVWNPAGNVILDNKQLAITAKPEKPGYGSIETANHTWRTFAVLSEPHTIRVGQRDDVRDELSLYIARHAILPNLVILPFLLFLIYLLVRRSLAPVEQLSKDLTQRDSNNLTPLSVDQAPRELDALTNEINALLKRVNDTYEREKRFTADAAHELRTPLAATSIHLENIQAIAADEKVRNYVHKASLGINRLRHLVDQLLLLRRMDSKQDRINLERVSINDCLESSCELVRESNDEAIDAIHLSKRYDGEILLYGNATELRILLRNLIDNAIKYRNNGTSVKVVLDRTELIIFNVCPEIEPKDLEHFFERFTRGTGELKEGSGLGLAISKRIAQKYGLTLLLSYGDFEGSRGVIAHLSWIN